MWLGSTNTAGSFMSFQIPATPTSTYGPLSWSPHQARAEGLVKSGKTLSPGLRSPCEGQTGALYTEPSGFLTNASAARPLSYSGQPGCALGWGSTMGTTRKPWPRRSRTRRAGSGNRSWFQVNGL